MLNKAALPLFVRNDGSMVSVCTQTQQQQRKHCMLYCMLRSHGHGLWAALYRCGQMCCLSASPPSCPCGDMRCGQKPPESSPRATVVEVRSVAIGDPPPNHHHYPKTPPPHTPTPHCHLLPLLVCSSYTCGHLYPHHANQSQVCGCGEWVVGGGVPCLVYM